MMRCFRAIAIVAFLATAAIIIVVLAFAAFLKLPSGNYMQPPTEIIEIPTSTHRASDYLQSYSTIYEDSARITIKNLDIGEEMLAVEWSNIGAQYSIFKYNHDINIIFWSDQGDITYHARRAFGLDVTIRCVVAESNENKRDRDKYIENMHTIESDLWAFNHSAIR